ncbi:MAG: DUF1653 domain-containing protein [Paraglaciecola sp.]|nr:DUF1653 domain-containing protein [Paraglaciecola sp.]NCT46906.1 DUF1653 domain-containing protein [Paraglaciecola sp.]
MPLQPGIYRHYKGQNYQVIGEAQHSEDESLYVVYKPLYGEQSLWIRPLSMFVEHVEVNGVRLPRFAFVQEA